MRYAIYFAPPSSDPLTRVATNWLGRDAFTDETVEAPAISGLNDAEIAFHTASPRRYGFHGTLKAPFSLASGMSENELVTELASFSGSVQSFEIPKLSITRIGAFFALVPDNPVAELEDLAARCVRDFEAYRAPLDDAEIERRSPQHLTPPQLANLQRWGYPYVFEEFRFHMTLTGPVGSADAPRIEQALHAFFDPVLSEPVEVRNIALFTEAETGAPFKVHTLFPLLADEQRRYA
ncbi:DUF1045 domain-containing protein [Hoeflea prorocentri]|uniref:DUF1045 domain-containing protein n=1 Tax=Hoeflea prorocentri TaxID=1922333 RepID=A0A9X3ZIH9_9HYPH|nr:DUF1045 domain-containing protein [Hoeflea prorocentri]MCY6382033.1 DUF1045 domain-containing protein [Hoeflea prorocentri]MDA5399833.1 DUF1045 domain-containing protein [Hoeflea prorocentri]